MLSLYYLLNLSWAHIKQTLKQKDSNVLMLPLLNKIQNVFLEFWIYAVISHHPLFDSLPCLFAYPWYVCQSYLRANACIMVHQTPSTPWKHVWILSLGKSIKLCLSLLQSSCFNCLEKSSVFLYQFFWQVTFMLAKVFKSHWGWTDRNTTL